MGHSSFNIFAIILFTIAVSCSQSHRDAAEKLAPDPFVGFFAYPTGAMLELKQADADGKYTGSIWMDFGPLPVELARDGNVARGTVNYDGDSHPLEVELAPQGLILVIDGMRAESALVRYENREAYRKTMAGAEGFQPVDGATSTRPTRSQ